MKSISLNFKDVSARLRQNISLSLWAGLLLLVVLVGWLVVRHSVGTLFSAKQTQPVPQAQLVRINLGVYDTIAKRFEAVGGFQPSPVAEQNPFGTLASSAKKP